MVSRIRRILAPPIFADEEKSRSVRLLNTVLLTFIGTVIVSLPILFFANGGSLNSEAVFTLLSAASMAVVASGLLVLARRGRLALASAIFLSLIWAIIAYWMFNVGGLKGDMSLLVFPMIIVLAGLLLGGRGIFVFTLLTLVAMAGAAALEVAGWLKVEYSPADFGDVLFSALPLALTGVLLRYAMNNMVGALERARQNERAQIQANRELQEIRASLEDRVVERTQDLERRSAQLQAAVEVSRVVTSILDADRLMWEVGELLCQRFGLYHVGLFELDSTGLWAIYRAGSGHIGVELVEQGFRLEVGGSSMIGWCTGRGQPRVVQDVQRETGRVDHPLVSQTRSEAALPLLARGHVIGAISVQSDRPGAFDPHTMAAIETIAEQVAVTLDNARLFAESQDALETARRAYGERSRQAWVDFLQARAGYGFTYSPQAMGSASGDWLPEMLETAQTGRPSQAGPGGDKGGERLAVPIPVRGQTVGVLGFEKAAADGPWTPEETQLLQGLAGQLGAALESAQLFEETQMRAARDRLIGEATGRLRQTLDVETILQTAIREIGQALALPEVEVRLLTASRAPRSGPPRPGGNGHGQGDAGEVRP